MTLFSGDACGRCGGLIAEEDEWIKGHGEVLTYTCIRCGAYEIAEDPDGAPDAED
jgi:hypothetical protein